MVVLWDPDWDLNPSEQGKEREMVKVKEKKKTTWHCH